MPNKRDPEKVAVSVYIKREIREMAMQKLREQGRTMTDFVYSKILELLNGEADKIIEEIKKQKKRDSRTSKTAKRK